MESLVPAQGRLLRLDPALILHWIMHWIMQSRELQHSTLPLCCVLQTSLQFPALCSISLRVTTSLLPPAVLLGGACPYNWPPRRTTLPVLPVAATLHCSWLVYCHHLARPGLWQSAIGRCLLTFK